MTSVCARALLRAALLPAAVAAAPIRFTDVTAEAGVRFRHSFGDADLSSILEATGSGCAFFDADGDGLLDLYAVTGSYLEGISDTTAGAAAGDGVNRLFRNRGDGTFADVTDRSGVGDRGYGMGCVAGDYDGDGRADLYVTNYGANRLYHNAGGGAFADATGDSGTGDGRWGVGATWLDFDLDGDVDLYVGNYLEFDPDYRLYYAADRFPGPLAYPGQVDVLLRNDGEDGFAEVTAEAGMARPGRAMGVTAADFDGDGWSDVFVANDAMANFLYRNRRNGTFEEVALTAGVAFSANGDASSSMGGDFGDYDGDGDLDLFVPDMAYNNLYVNDGTGYFSDHTAAAGVAEVSGQYVSWHGQFLDADNDGDLDLFVSTGSAHYLTHTQQALMLANVSAGGPRRFADVSAEAGTFFLRRFVSRGAAAGDYDGDGDLDLFVLHLDQPSVLLRNDGGEEGHWLELVLRGTRANRDALGARVRLRAGDRVQVAEKVSGRGYLGQGAPWLHFGLGARDRVDTLEVRWPGGDVTRRTGVSADRRLTIVQEGDR